MKTSNQFKCQVYANYVQFRVGQATVFILASNFIAFLIILFILQIGVYYFLFC